MKNYSRTGRLQAALAIASEAGQGQQRSNQYGEAIVSPLRLDQYAAEGTMFVTSNATIGTAVAIVGTNQTAYTATAPAFLIKNTEASGGKDIILKRLTMVMTGVGSSITSFDTAVVVDSTSRYTSGGVAATITNARADQANATVAQIYQASTAIVATSPTASARVIARRRLRSQTPVVSDQYVFNFGNDAQTESVNITTTLAGGCSINTAPVILPPGSTALVYLWATGMASVPVVEWMIEHIER